MSITIIRATAMVIIGLAIACFVGAIVVRCRFPQHMKRIAYPLTGFWVLLPPVWLWWEWNVYYRLQDAHAQEIIKHNHDLSRNVWVAYVVVLAVVLGVKWPPGD